MRKPKLGVFTSSLRSVTNGDLRRTFDLMAEMGFTCVNMGSGGGEGFQSLSPDERRELLVDYPRKLGLAIASAGDQVDAASRSFRRNSRAASRIASRVSGSLVCCSSPASKQ